MATEALKYMDNYLFTDPWGMEGWVGPVCPQGGHLPTTDWAHVWKSLPAKDIRPNHWATPPIVWVWKVLPRCWLSADAWPPHAEVSSRPSAQPVCMYRPGLPLFSVKFWNLDNSGGLKDGRRKVGRKGQSQWKNLRIHILPAVVNVFVI